VDDFSSKLDLPRNLEIVESIDANHMEMARCHDRADPRYRAILGVLRQFMRNEVPCVYSRPWDMPSMSQLQTLTAATQVPVTSRERSGPLRVLHFGRNKDFVGRQSQLNRLITILYSENIEEDCQRAALVGLGGVGKTQIALECAFQLQSMSPMCSVFWVRASDTTSFDNAYRVIGQQLEIPGLEDDKTEVNRLVKARLSQESTGSWLMIVDNADDFETFYNGNDNKGSGALSEYLPFSTLGAILFTTRDREAATRYAGSNVIDVDEMDDRESRDLLQRSLQNKELVKDEVGITTLLKSLVNLPLAIMQAAAYLNAKSSTIAEYLRLYTESGDNVIKLLSKDFEDIRRYPGMKNPVATTWLISFKQIQVRNPLAADYMAFISCIKEQDIPRDLLPPASEFDKTEALGTLQAFGFIRARLSGASYDMHRLVHIAMQNWLKLKDEWKGWSEKTLEEIVNVFPLPQHENRAVWMMYLPHAKCAIASFEQSFGEAKDLPWSLLHNLGCCCQLQGKYAEAEAMHRQTLQLKETVLGKEHPDTLMSMNNLAESLRQQGKYADAEAMHRQTLQLKETVLGKDHPRTLMSMMNLANSLLQQGKFVEAEVMHRQTLQLKETVLGKEHPDTLDSMNNLAISLRQQGKYAEAEVIDRQTLQLKETVYGKEHPSTLISMNNLALSLRQQGKYADAEAIHWQTLQLRETVLGKEHPDTLASMNNLAESLGGQGKYADAEAMHRQTLQLRETVLGKEYPDTLISMNNLAILLHQQGKYAEAEAMHRQTLQLQETVLGKEHPDTLASMNNLAESLGGQGKYAEAEAMDRQALQLRETVLGKEHPDTLASMNNLAESLRQQGKYAEVEEMNRRDSS
jgi:tetratricopeptide (TPR) repeat protein